MFDALRDVSCNVAAGDRIAVTGPSGSGKSTLLNVMAGIEPSSRGAVTWPVFGGLDGLRPRNIGMAFQTESLLPALNVVENVELPLLILHEPARQARHSAQEMLDTLGLGHLAQRLPEEVSGGQMQRVAMARALISRPMVVLADEPTGQLDQVTGQHLIDQLLDCMRDTPAALVIATHDEAIARRMHTRWRIKYGALDTSLQTGAAS